MKKIYNYILVVISFTLLIYCNVLAESEDTEYIKWVVNEEKSGEGYYYNIQIPNLNIDSYTAELINDDINSRFLSIYEDTLLILNCNVHIISEVNIKDDIISIKIEHSFSPVYGIDGETYVVNYSIEHDAIIPLGYVLLENNIDYGTLSLNINSQLENKSKFERIEYRDFSTFFIDNSGSPNIVVTTLHHPNGADEWQITYYYNVETKELKYASYR